MQLHTFKLLVFALFCRVTRHILRVRNCPFCTLFHAVYSLCLFWYFYSRTFEQKEINWSILNLPFLVYFVLFLHCDIADYLLFVLHSTLYSILHLIHTTYALHAIIFVLWKLLFDILKGSKVKVFRLSWYFIFHFSFYGTELGLTRVLRLEKA